MEQSLAVGTRVRVYVDGMTPTAPGQIVSHVPALDDDPEYYVVNVGGVQDIVMPQDVCAE